jgi:hypothetical protein
MAVHAILALLDHIVQMEESMVVLIALLELSPHHLALQYARTAQVEDTLLL